MAAVLHTTHGDLPVLLRYVECPTACFNFLALCASHYYDDCSFYRHIPGVLLQTGDPTNTGKGGDSIFAKVPEQNATESNDKEKDVLEETPDGNDAATAIPQYWRAKGPSRYFHDEGFGTTTHAARGVLSMAHRGTKADTNASQFFLLTAPQPAFDGLYTAFANVDLVGVYDSATRTLAMAGKAGKEDGSGEQTLRALEAAAAQVDAKHLVLEKESVKIVSTTILFNPFAEGTVKL